MASVSLVCKFTLDLPDCCLYWRFLLHITALCLLNICLWMHPLSVWWETFCSYIATKLHSDEATGFPDLGEICKILPIFTLFISATKPLNAPPCPNYWCTACAAAINYWCNMTLMLFCCTSPSYDFWGSKSPKLQSCFEKSNCSCLFPFGYEAGKAKSAHHPPRMAVTQLRCQTYLPNCIREHPRDLWPLRHFIRVRRDKKDKYIWRTPSKSDFSNLWPMSLFPLHGWHNMWTAPKDKDNSWHFEKSEKARVFPQIGLAHVDISESWEPQFMTLWPYNTRWL